MANEYEVTFKVNLIQGDPITFKVLADDDRRRNAASRLEQAMKSSYVGVKFPDRLILVPTNNIQSIEIAPPPPSIMVHVVNDATLIYEE
jgi:hypothetical protein